MNPPNIGVEIEWMPITPEMWRRAIQRIQRARSTKVQGCGFYDLGEIDAV